jgi:hypothetical protein
MADSHSGILMIFAERRQLFPGKSTLQTYYLTLEGLIEIGNTAALEPMPLKDVLQFFIARWNKSPNRRNTFGLAMLQQRLNQFAADAQPPIVRVNKYSVNNAYFSEWNHQICRSVD